MARTDSSGGVDQYVDLGAGLDSFAWRRPDLVASSRVFEVDHPASQLWKQERMAVLGLPESDTHLFVPVDFERDSLSDALDRSGRQ
jgi:O-methyltransferase involved in polyketide biosynthesis